jgi:PEP-CTERM motif-containing protein
MCVRPRGGANQVRMKPLILSLVVSIASSVSFGGAITSTTTAVGTSYTAVIGANSVKGSDLLNAIVVATFSNGTTTTTATCTFDNAGNCSSLGNFDLIVSPSSSQTNSAGWMADNLKVAGTWITSIDINVLPANDGFTVGSIGGKISGKEAGTSSASAAAVLQDRLHLASDPNGLAVTDYGRLILNFTTTAGTRLDGGTSFGFDAGNDFVTSAVPDFTPEPATYGLVGVALIGIGFLKVRRRRIATNEPRPIV